MGVTTLRKYFRESRGMAAVEFALVFPVMLIVLFGGFELSQVLQANRRATNVASTASDLVAQATVITNADRDDIFNAASAIMAPFGTGPLTIIVTSISNNAGTLAVDWSDALHAQPRSTVPSTLAGLGIVPPGSTIIMAETGYTYTSPIGKFFTSGVSMSDVFYDRPRRSVSVQRKP